MSSVVGMTAKQMGRAIIMPNLSPPIKTSEQALLYRQEIVQALCSVNLEQVSSKQQEILEEQKQEESPRPVQRKAAPQRRVVSSKQPVKNLKVGRNDPCPCGSGKKYKQCHG